MECCYDLFLKAKTEIIFKYQIRKTFVNKKKSEKIISKINILSFFLSMQQSFNKDNKNNADTNNEL